jgi:disulfide bond formation protein DsbB
MTAESPQRSAGTPLFLAWLVALAATAGALFLGEVMGKTPCVLCWYQRIAMFPLVLVLGVGLYHCLVFWGVISEALSPCRQGVSCADADVQVAGFVPIPLLSLMAFSAILALLFWNRRSRT